MAVRKADLAPQADPAIRADLAWRLGESGGCCGGFSVAASGAACGGASAGREGVRQACGSGTMRAGVRRGGGGSACGP